MRYFAQIVTMITGICQMGYAGLQVSGSQTTGTNSASTVVAVSNTDLADAASGATISNSSTVGSAGVGTIGALIDGKTTLSPGSVYFSDGSNSPDLLPNTQTITFNTSVNTNGYNLTSIVSYAGWHSLVARELANQNYRISYSTVSDPSTFIPLGDVVYQPFADGTAGDALTTVTVTDSVGPYLATHVKAIQLTFNPNGNSTGTNGVVYNEIDVIGTPTVGAALSITQPALDKTVIQRRADQKADIPIQGNYTGNPEKIEARVVALGGVRNGVTVASGSDSAWQTVAVSPSNGRFSGKLTDIAAGGWYRLEVRQSEGGNVTASAQFQSIGIGDIFVTAGQSNSANYGSPAATPVDNRCVALKDFTNVSWVLAADPQPIATGTGGSVWSRFGDLWTNAENVPVAFVSVGVGSTETSSWIPTATNYPRLRSAVQMFPANGFRAVLWHQGESDSKASVSAATYQANLQAIIDGSRVDAGWDIPWYVAQASFLPSTTLTQEMPVAAAQRAVAWAGRNVFLGPRTDDFHLESKVHDTVHFNAAGLADHADQWLQVLHSPTTPAIKNASFQSSTLADGAVFSVSNTNVASPSIPGWQALSADGTTVADAVVGYFNPNTSHYSAAADTGNQAGVVNGMQGTQCAFFYQGSAGCQLLQPMPQWIRADTDYAMTVAIGRRLNGTFGKARIELLGEGVVLATRDVLESDLPIDSFKDFTVTYRSPEVEASPRQLAVRISKIDGGTGTYLDFDHIRVNAVATGYQAWIGSQINSGGLDAQRASDPEGDGIANVFEYLLGTDPTKKNGMGIVTQTAGGVRFESTLRPGAMEPGFDLQYSFDLKQWNSVAPAAHPQVVSQRDGSSWRVEIPTSISQRVFFRFVAGS